MVTFRFYLVSIVAFFLALAVGVVLGSVLDEGISNSLKDRLERVETNLDETVAVMDQKNQEIADHEKFASESEPYLVENRLQGTTTMVVAESGLNAGPIEELVSQLRLAGSNTPGVIWVEKSWDPSSEKFVLRVTKALGLESAPQKQVVKMMWEAVLDGLVPESAAGSTTTTTTTPSTTTTAIDGTTPTTAPAPGGGSTPPDSSTVSPLEPIDIFDSKLLGLLAEGSVLRMQLVDGDNPIGGGTLNIVSITGAESDLAKPGEATSALAAVGGSRKIASVLAQQGSGDEKSASARGALLFRLLDDRVRATISTVDDVDLIPGRVATVMALQQYESGTTGSYGFGKHAESVLPKWPAQ